MSMMSVRFRLDHPIFRETLRAVPETELHWVRNVPRETGSKLLVWVDTDDIEAFRDAGAADETIAEILRTIDVAGRYLCEVELSQAGSDVDLYSVLLETGSVVQDATVTEDGWDCHFGFADQRALSSFFDAAHDFGFEYRIDRVYEPRDGDVMEDELTAAQREALRTAMDIGYFDVPRENGLQELGSELGISDSAASERLRRGLRSLIARATAGQMDAGTHDDA
jgi:predicted DNA binding protein